MRTNNSIKNISVSILTQMIMLLLTFFSRKVFIDNLGSEYLGVNGLLSNILSMLGLVEGGIGVSIVYNLYKPLAENDKLKITALIQLYKKIYTILAIVILIISIFIYPLLDIIIKGNTNIPYMGIVYFLFVFKNIISYLNAHKWSLINADQKGYLLGRYNLIFNIITTIMKIFVLKRTKNYILYLLIEMSIFVVQNLCNGTIVNRMYPYIMTNKKYEVDVETKNNLISNVKAIFLHKLGSYCVFSTDNILISVFVDINTVGLYSTYNLIISQLSSLVSPILTGIGASVGNLVAIESNEKSYEIFNITFLINFWIYSICTIFLYNLLEPFIIWWIGDKFLLSRLTLIIILVNFYITGLRSTVDIFKSKSGIFSPDRYLPLIESVINLGTSIVLVKYFGVAGIFMGTTISTISIPLWTQPKLVYNKVFNRSVIEYLKQYLFYILLTVIVCIITTCISNQIRVQAKFISLVIKGIVCTIIPNIIYILIFYKTDEFKYLLNIVRPIIIKSKSKLSRV